MTVQIAVATADKTTAQMVTDFAGGTLKLFSGSQPAHCSSSDPSGLLATGTLPSPALTDASGVTTLAGTWTVTGGSGAGSGTTAVTFRIYNSGGTCVCQGNVTSDLVMNNTNIANTQVLTVTSFTFTAGGM